MKFCRLGVAQTSALLSSIIKSAVNLGVKISDESKMFEKHLGKEESAGTMKELDAPCESMLQSDS